MQGKSKIAKEFIIIDLTRSLSQLKHESNIPVTSPEELSRIKISRFRLEK